MPDASTATATAVTELRDDANVCDTCGLPFPRQTVSDAAGSDSSESTTGFQEGVKISSAGVQVAHFQLRNLLGRGGFGEVWLAEDFRLGRLVALKLLKATHKDAKLLHEAKTAAKLKHPHIVSIFEVGVDKNQIYVASEYVDGSNLREKIRDGPVPVDETVALLATVARAVDHAHEHGVVHGVVHPDLKPENILTDSDGKPYVTDFGIAKQLSENETISSDG